MTSKRRSPPLPPKATRRVRAASAVPTEKPRSSIVSESKLESRTSVPNVLIIDDEETIVATWMEILKREGYLLGMATSAEEAFVRFEEREWDVVISDLRLPDGDGMALVAHVHKNTPATICIVLTGFPTLPSAIAAIHAGVHDYLIKPCKVDEMLASIRRGLAKRESMQIEAIAKRHTVQELKRLAGENLKLKAELRKKH